MKRSLTFLLALCFLMSIFTACNGVREDESGELLGSELEATDEMTAEITVAETTEAETTEAETTEAETTEAETTEAETTEAETTEAETTEAETTEAETTEAETTEAETTEAETTEAETTEAETTEAETTEEETTEEETTEEETTEEETVNWSPYKEDGKVVTRYPYADGDGVVHISFQDTYDFGCNVLAVNSISVTSFKSGSNEPDGSVLTVKGTGVYASGCGTGEVTLESGEVVSVTVHPSPINLLFLTGQSNGAGDPPGVGSYEEGEFQKYYIRSKETMAYYIYTGQGLSLDNAKSHVPNNLVWDTCFTNTMGCDPKVLTDKNHLSGFAGFSMCAGLAYEWTEQTGERVIVVNASHGGQPIHCFKPSEDGVPTNNDYYQAVAVFNEVLETLYREVDAGHFTLNHMAYYWYQGESDSNNTVDYYLDAFASMHANMMKDVVYSHGGVRKELEYCGIMTVRSIKDSAGNSAAEWYITSPRLAQYTAANDRLGVFSNVFIASNVNEEWVGNDAAVEKYFLRTYGSKENFKAIFGYDMPTALKTVKPDIHYRIFGHNEKGMDAARNSLRMLNILYPDRQYELSYERDEDKPELKIVSRDGYTPVKYGVEFDASTREAYLVPYITPIWRTVEGLSLRSLTEGVEVDGFRLILNDGSLSSFTVEIYLGEKLLDTVTLRLRIRTGFKDNLPLYINHGTSLHIDRYFERYVGAWDAGYLNFEDKSFTVYDKFNKIDNEVGWLNGGGKDGFNVSNQMTIGQAEDEEHGSLGIRYTAVYSGEVKIGADLFRTSQADCYIAIFVNGEQVMPAGAEDPADRSGWYLFTASDSAERINEKWADIRLELEAGDEVVFVVTGKGKSPDAKFFPYIEYVIKYNK